MGDFPMILRGEAVLVHDFAGIGSIAYVWML
jgi:hypothetical protein